jgi:glutathione S-transferase
MSARNRLAMVELPILYSFRRCPFAMRARMALLVSGKTCVVREVMLRDKPDAMVAASPKATVPVLVPPDGAVIDQSLDIMRWSLGISDPEGWLEKGGADAEALIATNDGPFKHHLDRYKYATRHDSDPIEHRDAGMTILADLNHRVAGSNNLFGDVRSFADIALFPFVRQFAATDREWFDAQALSNLQSWLTRHLRSALFETAMIKLKQWRPADAEIALPDYDGEPALMRTV